MPLLSSVGVVYAFILFAAFAFVLGGVALLLARTGGLWRTAAGLAGVTVGGALFLFSGASAALAADGPTVYAVTLPKDLVPMLLDYLFVGLFGGVLWLGRRAAAWLHLSRESMLVQRFDHGAEAALNYARERVLAKGGELKPLETRSELVKIAGEYLLPKIPGILKELKIDPAGLHDRLTARLDVAAPLASSNAASSLPR